MDSSDRTILPLFEMSSVLVIIADVFFQAARNPRTSHWIRSTCGAEGYRKVAQIFGAALATRIAALKRYTI